MQNHLRRAHRLPGAPFFAWAKLPLPQLSHPQTCLIQRNLAVAADLVGDLFPGRRNRIGGFLRRFVGAGIALGQFILGNRVLLEDARNARLDRRIGVVMAKLLSLECVWQASDMLVYLVGGQWLYAGLRFAKAGSKACRFSCGQSVNWGKHGSQQGVHGIWVLHLKWPG